MRYSLVRSLIFSLIVCWCSALLQSTANLQKTVWEHIIEDEDITTELRLVGSGWDNTLVRNCRIHDTGPSGNGIFLRDVSNVRIEGCEIYNISGHAGIKLSSWGGTENVLITGNTFHDIQNCGILSGEDSERNPPIEQVNLQIVGNYFHGTGLAGTDGKLHPIYIQSSEYLIEGNVLYGYRDGNGISVRSSGIIRGNTISGYSASSKPAIRYYSDHVTGASETLIIENNIVYNDGSPGYGIDIYRPVTRNGGLDHVVKRFIIRFNTAVSLQANSFAIHVDEGWGSQDYTLRVEGNIAINTASDSRIVRMPPNVSARRNYYASTLDNFAGSTPPYDFHINDQHGARDYATGLGDYPALDIDAERRDPDRLDAGADQF